MHRTRVLPLVAAAAAALALTACGADKGGDYSANPVPVEAPAPLPGETPAAAVPSATPAAPVPAQPPAPPAGGVTLTARQAPGVGTVVVDAQGFTLYRFDRDTPRPPAATCVDQCAAKWPPVVVDPEGALRLEGVEQSAIGMVQRPDGSSQLTIGGWPVYHFAGDKAPGATGGQGVDGTWSAVTPTGGKAG